MLEIPGVFSPEGWQTYYEGPTVKLNASWIVKPWSPTVINAVVVAEPLRKRGSVPVKLCLQAQASGVGLHGLWTLADLSLSLVLGIWDTVEERKPFLLPWNP